MADCFSGRIALRVGLAWALVAASIAIVMRVGFQAFQCTSSEQLDCTNYEIADDKADFDKNHCFQVQSDYIQCVTGLAMHDRTWVYVSYLLIILAAACLVSVGFMRRSQPAEGGRTGGRAVTWSTWAKIVATIVLFVLGVVAFESPSIVVAKCITPEYSGCIQDEVQDNKTEFDKDGCFEVVHDLSQCINDAFANKKLYMVLFSGYLIMLLSIIVSSTLCCCQPGAHRASEQNRAAPKATASEAAPPSSDMTAPLVAHSSLA